LRQRNLGEPLRDRTQHIKVAAATTPIQPSTLFFEQPVGPL
jgi:hypothetical protein